jgi:hypothetical protein
MPGMASNKEVDKALEGILGAISDFAETISNATSSGAARDNAETIERLANAANALAPLRGMLPD